MGEGNCIGAELSTYRLVCAIPTLELLSWIVVNDHKVKRSFDLEPTLEVVSGSTADPCHMSNSLRS